MGVLSLDLEAKLSQNYQILEFFNLVFSKDKLVNAYLFVGENSYQDKMDLFVSINKTLNCVHNQGHLSSEFKQPCGICDSCTWIQNNEHPKTPLVLEREEGAKTVKVSQVHKLQEELSQSSPYYRLILIPEADFEVFSKHPANALLKSIEEAYPRTMFILFARAKETVLTTIRSRTQVLYFQDEPQVDSVEVSDKIFEVYEKYKAHNDFSSQIKNKLFVDEILKMDKAELIKFLDYLVEQIELSAHNVKFIESLERSKRYLEAYVNPRAALSSVAFY